MPNRTVFGPMRTIVTATLSPIRMRSPGFRDRTSIGTPPSIPTTRASRLCRPAINDRTSNSTFSSGDLPHSVITLRMWSKR